MDLGLGLTRTQESPLCIWFLVLLAHYILKEVPRDILCQIFILLDINLRTVNLPPKHCSLSEEKVMYVIHRSIWSFWNRVTTGAGITSWQATYIKVYHPACLWNSWKNMAGGFAFHLVWFQKVLGTFPVRGQPSCSLLCLACLWLALPTPLSIGVHFSGCAFYKLAVALSPPRGKTTTMVCIKTNY